MSGLTYNVFGLNIRSPLEIPDVVPVDAESVDVEIRFGKNPAGLRNVRSSGILYEAAENEFLLKLPRIGSYYVTDGNQVTIEANSGVSDDEVRLFLTGSVFGAILYQRGYLPLHGSAVEAKGYALLTTGSSASGKSTLAAALNREGFPLISDDLSAISVNDSGKCVVFPGLPFFKLWEDTRDPLFGNTSFRRVRPQLKKFIIPADSHAKRPCQIQKLIWMTTKNSEGFRVHPVQGARKLKLLRENLYRDQMIRGTGLPRHHFTMLSTLANQTEMYHVERPSNPLDIDPLKNLVLKEILEI